jgi:hypothetical protein
MPKRFTRKESIEDWSDRKIRQGRSGKGLKYAVDHFCGSFDPVGAGIGYFVHDGRIRPYPIGRCRDHSRDKSFSGTEKLVAVSTFQRKQEAL